MISLDREARVQANSAKKSDSAKRRKTSKSSDFSDLKNVPYATRMKLVRKMAKEKKLAPRKVPLKELLKYANMNPSQASEYLYGANVDGGEVEVSSRLYKQVQAVKKLETAKRAQKISAKKNSKKAKRL